MSRRELDVERDRDTVVALRAVRCRSRRVVACDRQMAPVGEGRAAERVWAAESLQVHDAGVAEGPARVSGTRRSARVRFRGVGGDLAVEERDVRRRARGAAARGLRLFRRGHGIDAAGDDDGAIVRIGVARRGRRKGPCRACGRRADDTAVREDDANRKRSCSRGRPRGGSRGARCAARHECCGEDDDQRDPERHDAVIKATAPAAGSDQQSSSTCSYEVTRSPSHPRTFDHGEVAPSGR